MKKGLIPATILAMLALLATGCGITVNYGDSSEAPASSQPASDSGSQGSESTSEGGSQGGSESGSQGGSSESGSQGGSSESSGGTSESSGGSSSSESSSSQTSSEDTANYGSLSEPLTLAQIKAEFANYPLTSGGYTSKHVFVKAKLKANPEAEDATQWAFTLVSGDDELVVGHAKMGDFEAWKDDEVIVQAYAKKRTNAEQTAGNYPIGFRLTYNPVTDTTVADPRNPTVVGKVAANATLNKTIDEHVNVTGLQESYKNGDTVSFQLAPQSGYAISAVTLDGIALTANAGTYSFTIHGTMSLVVTAASTEAHATGVTITPTSPSVKVGKTVQLSATVQGDAGVIQSVTWTVESGGTKAEVSASGLVTGLAEGSAVIRATAVAKDSGGNDVYAEATVTVEAAEVVTFASLDNENIEVDSVLARVIAVSGQNVFVDDGTAGLVARAPSAPSGISAGDAVLVSGTTAWYNNMIQIGSASFESTTDAAPTPAAATALSKEDAAAKLSVNITPGAKVTVSDTNGLLAIQSGTFINWSYGETPMTMAGYSPVQLGAGYKYSSITGYLNGTAGGNLQMVITAAEKIDGKLTLTSSEDSAVVDGDPITLTAASEDLASPEYTWSVTAKTAGASAQLSATSGASITLTGKATGTVTVTVENNAGYSASKDIAITDGSSIDPVYVSAAKYSFTCTQSNTAMTDTSAIFDIFTKDAGSSLIESVSSPAYVYKGGSGGSDTTKWTLNDALKLGKGKDGNGNNCNGSLTLNLSSTSNIRKIVLTGYTWLANNTLTVNGDKKTAFEGKTADKTHVDAEDVGTIEYVFDAATATIVLTSGNDTNGKNTGVFVTSIEFFTVS